MTKAGRNDPCPCGSGKKHKKCCLLKQQHLPNFDLLYRRLRETEGKLMAKIDSCFDKHYPDEAMGECLYEFNLWGEEEDLESDFDEPEYVYMFPVFSRFHWQVDIHDTFDDCQIPEKIPAQYLLDSNKYLPELEKNFAITAMKSPFSFYLVKAVEAGKSILLEDFFTGEQVKVIEKQASVESVVDSVLFTSVISLQGISFMLGMAPYPFPSSYAIDLIPFKEAMLKNNKVWSTELIAQCDIEFREFYFGFKDRMLAPPVMVNNNDEFIVLHQIEYQVFCPIEYAIDKLASLNKLEPSEGLDNALFDEDDEYNKITETTMHWLERINGQYISCAELTLTDDMLIINVNSDERAAAIKRKISRRLGKQAMLMCDDITDMDELRDKVATNQLNDTGDISADDFSSDDFLPEELAKIEQDFLQAHYVKWLDEPVPALDNKTPRQASKSKQGREKLILLLDDFESRGGAPVDWLREQLSIE
ncbi:MAG: SEC-C domain-containing protein [Colwellia sp.]|nr:SEC-C domain-containing protein [Colwellia sp.]